MKSVLSFARNMKNITRLSFFLGSIVGYSFQTPLYAQTIVHTVAGRGPSVMNGVPATQTSLRAYAFGISPTNANIYIGDAGNGLRVVDSSGIINLVAPYHLNTQIGLNFYCVPLEGVQVSTTCVGDIRSMTLDPAGNMYVYFFQGGKVFKITPDGIITTFAGVDNVFTSAPSSGDGGPASAATVGDVLGLGSDLSGNVYIVTSNGSGTSIRVVDTSGIINTFYVPPQDSVVTGNVAADSSGNRYIMLSNAAGADQVLRITPQGVSSVVAGTQTAGAGNTGDGGLATSATFGRIRSIAASAAGDVYITDDIYGVIRRVSSSSGIIQRVVGSGLIPTTPNNYGGDNTAPLSTNLSSPHDIHLDSNGSLYINDIGNSAIRKLQ